MIWGYVLFYAFFKVAFFGFSFAWSWIFYHPREYNG